MSFDKFTKDAGTFFNRAIQRTEEMMKTSEPVLLDPTFEKLMKDVKFRQQRVAELISKLEAVVEPNPANRMENLMLKTANRSKEREHDNEILGDFFINLADGFGRETADGKSMILFGQTQQLLGQSARAMQSGIETNYLNWLRKYLAEIVKPALQDCNALDQLRLDLGRAKGQLKRAKDEEAKQKAEQALAEAQRSFDTQCDTAKRQLHNCLDVFKQHNDHMNQMLRAQQQYYKEGLDTINKAFQSKTEQTPN